MGQSWMDRASSAVGSVFEDWEGTKDRLSASFELGNKFNIVDDGFTGKRLPNTVSADEYADIVRTYSDIRLGRGDLTIDTSEMTPGSEQETDYRGGVMDDLAALLQTKAGRQTLQTLHASPKGHHAFIRARHDDTDGDGDPTNDGNSAIAPDNAGVLAHGQGSAMNADGTAGPGTDVDILYNPGVNAWEYQDAILNPYWVDENPWALQTRSDVTLAHEMAHAVYSTSGLKDWSDVAPADGVRVDAEFGVPRREHQGAGLGLYGKSVIGENAYRRERRAIAEGGGPGTLDGDKEMVERGSYHGSVPVPPNMMPCD